MLEKLIKGAVIAGLAASLAGCAAKEVPIGQPHINEKSRTSLQNIISADNSFSYDTITGLAPNMYGEIPTPKIYKKYDEGPSCAGYAVTLARDRYCKDFIFQDAWNIRFRNESVTRIKSEDHVNYLVNEEILKPGMILAVRYLDSNYLRNQVDGEGFPREYTHLVVFVGTDEKGIPTFQHQFEGREESITWDGLEDLNSRPIELFDAKGEIKGCSNPFQKLKF